MERFKGRTAIRYVGHEKLKLQDPSTPRVVLAQTHTEGSPMMRYALGENVRIVQSFFLPEKPEDRQRILIRPHICVALISLPHDGLIFTRLITPENKM